jgi:uncharacterized membrane protein YgaE (UPF0421/DUF939 family)
MKFKFFKNQSKEDKKDAFRLALQSAVAASLCYVLMTQLDLKEMYVGLLSAVLVIEPSIGNTYFHAKGRILSTLVGVGIGLVFSFFLPLRFGESISLFFSIFLLAGISYFKPEWRYGIVGAIAMAMAPDENPFDVAIDRLIAIGLGALIGIIITLIVWPNSSEKRTIRYVRKSLKHIFDKLKTEFQNTRDSNNEGSSKSAKKFSSDIDKAKSIASNIAFSKKENLEKLIEKTEKLYNSVIIIQRVAKRSENNISDGDSGIKDQSNKVTEKACSIIEKFSKNKKLPKQEIEEFSELISKTKSSINQNPDDKELGILRNTFMFSLTEIEECIKGLFETFHQIDS